MFFNAYLKKFTFVLFPLIFVSAQVFAKTITVLSIDGGGIRGIIPAMFLEELTKRSGLEVHKMFDEIVGTSTGGIIALGLSVADSEGRAKYTPKDLVELYSLHGKEIFDSSIFRQGIFRSRYDPTRFEELLDERFNDAKLSESLTNVVVTSYDMEHATPFFMSSVLARTDGNQDFYVKDAARATSAAPTYFPPATIYSVADKSHDAPRDLIDGGVIINNPSFLGYVSARRDFPEADEYLVVSVGTGDARHRVEVDDIHSGGAIFWAAPLIELMLNGVSSTNHELMTYEFPYEEKKAWQKYYRIQVPIAPDLEPMDKTSSKHIEALKNVGSKMIKMHNEQIDEIVRAIQSIKGVASQKSSPEEIEAAFKKAA